MYLTFSYISTPQCLLHKQINTPTLFMISNADIFLVSSVLLETISTCCLKYTINNKLWFIPVYTGYAISFWTFPKSLEKYSLSLAYSIWSGTGIVLTTFFDKLLYKEIITFKRFFANLLIIIGILISK